MLTCNYTRTPRTHALSTLKNETNFATAADIQLDVPCFAKASGAPMSPFAQFDSRRIFPTATAPILPPSQIISSAQFASSSCWINPVSFRSHNFGFCQKIGLRVNFLRFFILFAFCGVNFTLPRYRQRRTATFKRIQGRLEDRGTFVFLPLWFPCRGGGEGFAPLLFKFDCPCVW